MLRLFLALAVIAVIYSHSPHRPEISFRDNLASFTRQVSDQALDKVATSGLGPTLTEAVLRRTLAEGGPAGKAVPPEAQPGAR
ncbi:hypothetical protein [Enterovirga sp.]|jgi:hypothetical protein|uniref:hypothetical protein n=1 Tax=Enterovirga sp. TaxID=2026350 RepID=UPI00262F99EA|nr:hypothetical protein [Enterovirga sp.]MDB5590697.1 hypothetical protein [Enterovirga sp.]